MPGQCEARPSISRREAGGIGGWPSRVIPHMAVRDAGARLERLMRALHLLGDADRHRRIVGLGRVEIL